ncbi:MAG: DNA repair exonuclease [Crenarchaeota archaeon]|nr:DNA repair exonuclease [Thermoproteota archaeon]
MLVLHAADVHLGKRQYALKEREEDFYRAFSDMIEAALRERVDAVLVSGDLFDSPVPSTSMKPFKVAVEGFKRLKESGVEVFAIPGDHDYPKVRGYPAIGYLAELTGIKLLMGERGAKGVEFKGFVVRGVEAVTRGREGPLELLRRARAERNSVLLLHAGICRVLPFECLEEHKVPPGYKYYALGHVHKPYSFDLHGSLALYPGSLEITSVDDISAFKWEGGLKEGPALVDLSGDEAEVVGRIKVRARRQVVLSYTLPDDFKRALKEAREVPEGAVVHVIFTGRPSRESVKAVVRELSARALAVRPVVKASPSKAEVRASETRFLTIEDALVELYGKELGALLLELVAAAQEGSPAELREAAERLFQSGAWRRALRASSRRGR